jgi:hypothetical protein
LLRPPNWNRYVSSIPTSGVSSSCSRWAASSGDSDRFIVPPGNDHRDLTRATRSTWPSPAAYDGRPIFHVLPYRTRGCCVFRAD